VSYFSQLIEESGNPSVACHPAYQAAATGLVERAAVERAAIEWAAILERAAMEWAVNGLALTTDRAKRGKTRVDNMTRDTRDLGEL
jgi:hypothetical protein